MPKPVHPAACRYCAGTIVNQCETVFKTRPARLDDDGSIVVGESLFENPGGISLLFCHGCTSTYEQPADVDEVHDPLLTVDYSQPAPEPGDPAYRGMGVAWTPTPAYDHVTVITAGQG